METKKISRSIHTKENYPEGGKMINPNYIKANAQLRKEVADLKVKIAEREIQEYAEWKKENEKSRAAMDKVLSELKAKEENNDWVLMEDDLRNLEIMLTTQNQVMEILKKMISSVTYDKISVEEFQEYESKFSKWFEV